MQCFQSPCESRPRDLSIDRRPRIHGQKWSAPASKRIPIRIVRSRFSDALGALGALGPYSPAWALEPYSQSAQPFRAGESSESARHGLEGVSGKPAVPPDDASGLGGPWEPRGGGRHELVPRKRGQRTNNRFRPWLSPATGADRWAPRGPTRAHEDRIETRIARWCCILD